jgi:hypothetical protein
MLRDMCTGFLNLITGKTRARYTILKEINAPDKTISEMRIFSAGSFAAGIVVGFCFTMVGICAYYLTTQL